ncbi:phage/plasmid primase, P4 family [Novosphingobium sp.]|uniref:DNA primase family protein n=1 Tax=Novosphingobium sp. TaxID=1874826 RepID=UPI0038BB34CF
MSDSLIPVPVDDPLSMAWFECNDYGNARRLVVLSKGLLRWVDDEFWVAFDGQRWSAREGSYRARQLAHEVSLHIHDEVAALGAVIGDPKNPDGQALVEKFGDWCTSERALDRLKLLSGHAIKSGNANQTDAMLKQAKDMPEMRAWSEEFDVDPLTYNVQNGTLRFRQDAQGRWRCQFRDGHDPADMLRQIANWTYDAKATCPMWLERLELVQPDVETRAVFARMYGQTLTGLTDCEEFYVHKGRGGDGKTKTHEILAHGHGDYYRDTSIKTFLQASIQKSGSEHRSDLVRLAGDIRMVVAPEPPPRSTWDGETIKTVTGGGMVTARGSGARTEITFKPRWKLFVEVNPTPSMPSDDKGFRRRFRLVQWLVDLNTIPGGFESPAALRERLWSEQAGVLNWLIAGCLEWLADRRVPVPEREAEALADFWATGNPLAEWMAEEADISDRDAETPSKVLFDAFKAWMERNEIEEDAVKKWNATRFGRELGQRQIVGKKDRRGNKVRRGIRLRVTDPFAADDPRSSADRPQQRSAEPTAQNFADQDGAVGDKLDPFGDL